MDSGTISEELVQEASPSKLIKTINQPFVRDWVRDWGMVWFKALVRVLAKDWAQIWVQRWAQGWVWPGGIQMKPGANVSFFTKVRRSNASYGADMRRKNTRKCMNWQGESALYKLL